MHRNIVLVLVLGLKTRTSVKTALKTYRDVRNVPAAKSTSQGSVEQMLLLVLAAAAATITRVLLVATSSAGCLSTVLVPARPPPKSSLALINLFAKPGSTTNQAESKAASQGKPAATNVQKAHSVQSLDENAAASSTPLPATFLTESHTNPRHQQHPRNASVPLQRNAKPLNLSHDRCAMVWRMANVSALR